MFWNYLVVAAGVAVGFITIYVLLLLAAVKTERAFAARGRDSQFINLACGCVVIGFTLMYATHFSIAEHPFVAVGGAILTIFGAVGFLQKLRAR